MSFLEGLLKPWLLDAPPPRDSDSADLEWGPRVFISNQFPGEAAAASPPRAALKNHWLRANKCPIVEKHLPVYVLMTEELRHVPVSFFYRKADTSQSELRIEFSMVWKLIEPCFLDICIHDKISPTKHSHSLMCTVTGLCPYKFVYLLKFICKPKTNLVMLFFFFLK